MSLLTVEKLSFAYRNARGISRTASGAWSLKEIDFSVEAGEYIALVGPNGSGKSTLFHLLSSQLPAETGRVLLSGHELRFYTPRERAMRLALIPQGTRINFPYSALEFVLMGLYPHRSRFQPLAARDLEWARELMSETGIWHLAERRVTELSGGQMQSVLLARALLQLFPQQETPPYPVLMLLDEATSALDIAARIAISRLLSRYTARGTAAVIGIQHDLHSVPHFASRVIALYEGAVAADGTPDEVFTELFFKRVFAVKAEIIAGKGFVFE